MTTDLSSLDLQSRVAVTIDVEWAHPEVLRDVLSLLDERGVTATLFCTHDGIDAGRHERALHPNFLREGNSAWNDPSVVEAARQGELAYWRRVVEAWRNFAPEAVGVRPHGLFYQSLLLPIYAEAGLQYDSSDFLPLMTGLQPVWKGSGILELPIYYMDYWDMREQATGFSLENLRLDEPGLKVLCFHPNLIYANYSCVGSYLETKGDYHDPRKLLEFRRAASKTGVRDLFLRLLDRLATSATPAPTLGEINAAWREGRPPA